MSKIKAYRPLAPISLGDYTVVRVVIGEKLPRRFCYGAWEPSQNFDVTGLDYLGVEADCKLYGHL